MKKRIIALLLSLVMLFGVLGTLSLYAFADETAGETEVTEGEDPETPTEPEEPEIPLSGNIYLYLCSNWNSVVPHVFIYVVNETDHDIRVGYYDLPSGQGVSLGSFGMTVSDGPGVYYNIECYRNRGYDVPPNFMCISKTVSESELSSMSSYIKGANWWDPVAVNCCFFAAMCWNKAGGSYVFPLVCFPWLLRMQISAKGASHTINLNKSVTPNDVYKQSSGGIRVVTSGSLS